MSTAAPCARAWWHRGRTCMSASPPSAAGSSCSVRPPLPPRPPSWSCVAPCHTHPLNHGPVWSGGHAVRRLSQSTPAWPSPLVVRARQAGRDHACGHAIQSRRTHTVTQHPLPSAPALGMMRNPAEGRAWDALELGDEVSARAVLLGALASGVAEEVHAHRSLQSPMPSRTWGQSGVPIPSTARCTDGRSVSAARKTRSWGAPLLARERA